MKNETSLLDVSWNEIPFGNSSDRLTAPHNVSEEPSSTSVGENMPLDKRDEANETNEIDQPDQLRSQQSFVSATNKCDRSKRVIICSASSALAMCVGLLFGTLSVEDATQWSMYIYRFTPSLTVNFMGSLLAIQDLLPLMLKLKKDPGLRKRDRAVIGPFTCAFVLMVFAVVATLPLAKDAASDLLQPTSWFSRQVGLSDRSRLAMQWICMILWCVGYTGPTRIDTGYAIGRELYEDSLMRFMQPNRYELILLARDMKRFTNQANTVWNKPEALSLVSRNEVTEFYDAVQNDPNATARSGMLSRETLSNLPRWLMMLGCVPLVPLLQDEAQRGWSELGVTESVSNIMLGVFATMAAFVFFVRSSQLFLERLMLAFKGVANRLENCGLHPHLAGFCSGMYLLLLASIGVGSSFGWYYEAKEFEQGHNPLQKATFTGYPIYFAFYAFIANFGFELNFTNRCINTANKHEVPVLKAALQLLTGLFTLNDKRSNEAKRAENRLVNLSKGKVNDDFYESDTENSAARNIIAMRKTAFSVKRDERTERAPLLSSMVCTSVN